MSKKNVIFIEKLDSKNYKFFIEEIVDSIKTIKVEFELTISDLSKYTGISRYTLRMMWHRKLTAKEKNFSFATIYKLNNFIKNVAFSIHDKDDIKQKDVEQPDNQDISS